MNTWFFPMVLRDMSFLILGTGESSHSFRRAVSCIMVSPINFYPVQVSVSRGGLPIAWRIQISADLFLSERITHDLSARGPLSNTQAV